MKTGFDYSDFWKEGNYTLKADGIRCSALIIHGLNDENVSTKQFEMMLHSFEEADRTVKVILHQGPHITPTMANKGYGISINGRNYDDIVNKWISHYLYDVENDAEDMPAVLVQNNVDRDQWDEVDSWETECDYEFCSSLTGTTVIDTDWEKAGINKENFDERMSLLDSNMNQRYFSNKAADDLTIQGSVCVKFDAALKDGDASKNFEPENINDADRLSFELGSASGKMDDVKLTVLLCDVADEEFPSIQTVDPERNVIPVVVRNKAGLRSVRFRNREPEVLRHHPGVHRPVQSGIRLCTGDFREQHPAGSGGKALLQRILESGQIHRGSGTPSGSGHRNRGSGELLDSQKIFCRNRQRFRKSRYSDGIKRPKRFHGGKRNF